MALLKSIKDTYSIFIKQMCKIQWAVSHTLWAWAKRRFNINMFHIIGPTSSNVSAVLFTPWPIVIIHITMCLKVKTTSQGLLKNISIQSLSKTKVLKKIWMNRINSLKSFWADISFVLQTINPNLNPTNQTEGSNTYYGCYLILILVPWCQDKVKFIYSEKASKCCEIFTLHLPKVHTVKSKVKISQTFVAFSEYMNFKIDKGR